MASKDPGVPSSSGIDQGARVSRAPGRDVPRQALAPLQHGGRATVALAPLTRSMKQALLKRMGLRQAELTWAGRETLTNYARTLAKLKAIEDWLATHPMLAEDGTPAPCMALFSTLSNTATRQLGELRAVVADMAREDDRYDAVVQALIAEGRKTRTGRETSDA
jgi:predicted nuclease with RNAse H fold